MKKNVKRFFKIQIFNIYYYIDYIRENRIFFGSENNDKDSKIDKPFVHVILPSIICIIFAVRSFFSLILSNYEHRILVGTFMVPREESKKIDFLCTVWSILHFCYTFWVLPYKLKHFKYLACFAMEEDGDISPEDMGLKMSSYKIFDKFRKYIMTSFYITTFSITYGAMIATLIQASTQIFRARILQIILTLLWETVLYFWVHYVCFTAYGFSSLNMIIIFYVILKQTSIEDFFQYIINLNYTASYLYMKRIYKYQAYLMNEMNNYRKAMRRGLSALFFNYILILTYLAYILGFTNIVFHYLFLFSVVGFAHVFYLANLIFLCSKVANHNNKTSKMMLKIYNDSSESSKLNRSVKEQLKTTNVIASIRQYQNRFELVNQMVIDSTSYYVVSIVVFIYRFT